MRHLRPRSTPPPRGPMPLRADLVPSRDRIESEASARIALRSRRSELVVGQYPPSPPERRERSIDRARAQSVAIHGGGVGACRGTPGIPRLPALGSRTRIPIAYPVTSLIMEESMRGEAGVLRTSRFETLAPAHRRLLCPLRAQASAYAHPLPGQVRLGAHRRRGQGPVLATPAVGRSGRDTSRASRRSRSPCARACCRGSPRGPRSRARARGRFCASRRTVRRRCPSMDR